MFPHHRLYNKCKYFTALKNVSLRIAVVYFKENLPEEILI